MGIGNFPGYNSSSPDPDIFGFNQVMREAFGHARDTGVFLIVYPEKSGAA
jgi:hypothetical protein